MGKQAEVPCVMMQNDEPTVYNKGTQWETVFTGPFLHCYAESDEQARRLADKLNRAAQGRRYYADRAPREE